MEATPWLAQNWFELLQSIGIVGGLLFTAYATWRNDHSRRISNSIAISNQHRELLQPIYSQSDVTRVLDQCADIRKQPISLAEENYTIARVGHLSTAYRAIKKGELVKLKGLRKDVQQFFALPIPGAVWEKLKPLQDDNLVIFVESCMRGPELNL